MKTWLTYFYKYVSTVAYHKNQLKFQNIRLVGKLSWKDREVGNFYVDKTDMELEKMKLESSDRG